MGWNVIHADDVLTTTRAHTYRNRRFHILANSAVLLKERVSLHTSWDRQVTQRLFLYLLFALQTKACTLENLGQCQAERINSLHLLWWTFTLYWLLQRQIERQVSTENVPASITYPATQDRVHHLSLIGLKAARLNLCFNTLHCHKKAHVFLPTFTMNLKQHTPATLK